MRFFRGFVFGTLVAAVLWVLIVFGVRLAFAQERRSLPPLELQWKTSNLACFCETTTGNRIYYLPAQGGVAVVQDDCP